MTLLLPSDQCGVHTVGLPDNITTTIKVNKLAYKNLGVSTRVGMIVDP